MTAIKEPLEIKVHEGWGTFQWCTCGCVWMLMSFVFKVAHNTFVFIYLYRFYSQVIETDNSLVEKKSKYSRILVDGKMYMVSN